MQLYYGFKLMRLFPENEYFRGVQLWPCETWTMNTTIWPPEMIQTPTPKLYLFLYLEILLEIYQLLSNDLPYKILVDSVKQRFALYA